MKGAAQRVAVTGVGIVSPLGIGARTAFERLCAGERAIAPVSLFDVAGYKSRMAAEVLDLDVAKVAPAREADTWSRTDAMAVLAAREALGSAQLAVPSDGRLGVAVGGTTGGMFEAERLLSKLGEPGSGPTSSARRLLSYPLSTTVDRVVESIGATGPRLTLCSACSSSAASILTAATWIAQGRVDRALAGGADGLCRLTFAGFNALGAMDSEPCRPFDKGRQGMNLGEGAAFLLLESEASVSARSGSVIAWLSGWALGAEAHHITLPDPSGRRPVDLMREAIGRAGLEPSAVDYINAHGTGTLPNDKMEATAIRAVFGTAAERIRVSSSKGQIGHTLGASGALEAAFTVMALHDGRAPPTAGLTEPESALRHVMGVAEEVDIDVALSTSFGFGGAGAVLVFQRKRPTAPPSASPSLVMTAAASIGPLGILRQSEHVRYVERDSGVPADQAPEVLAELDARRSRRFDRATSFAAVCAEHTLKEAGLCRAEAGMVIGTAYGNAQRAVAFTRALEERGPARVPPAEFPHLLPSAPAGNASIYSGLEGPVASVCHVGASGQAALHAAFDWLGTSSGRAIIAGAVEVEDPIVAGVLAPLHRGEAGYPRREGAAFVVVEEQGYTASRAGRPLARVEAYGQYVSGVLHGAFEPPASAAAKVVLSLDEARAAPFLERVGWTGIESIDVRRMCGAHEAAGAFAVAAAVGLIASRQVPEALVVGGTAGVIYFTLLGRIAE